MKREDLRWQAENIVREAIKQTPAYRKAVKETIKEIEATQRNARKLIGKK